MRAPMGSSQENVFLLLVKNTKAFCGGDDYNLLCVAMMIKVASNTGTMS
jgi:hypothetical protein